MKPRKIYVTLELWTDLPLEQFDGAEEWAGYKLIPDWSTCKVLHVHANESQDPPED